MTTYRGSLSTYRGSFLSSFGVILAGENGPKRCRGVQNRALQRLGSILEMWSKLVVNCERSGVQFGNILASSCPSHRFFASSGQGKTARNHGGLFKIELFKFSVRFPSDLDLWSIWSHPSLNLHLFGALWGSFCGHLGASRALLGPPWSCKKASLAPAGSQEVAGEQGAN